MARSLPLPVLAFASLLAAAAPAFAGDETPGMPPMAPKPPMDAPPPASGGAPNGGRFFDTYDANQDGKVTKEEFSGDADVFELLDKNADGAVSLDELGLPADYRPRPLPKEQDGPPGGGDMKGGELRKRAEKLLAELAGMDKDGDKKVTKEEYNGKLPFEFLDKNKDGVLDAADVRRPGGGDGGGKFVPKGGKPDGGMMSPEDVERRFKDQDKNADGRISKDEFPGPAERFTALDKDGDGGICVDELKAGMAGDGMRGRRMMAQFDKNGDGKVTRDEFPGGDEMFQKMDKNGDGAISDDELPRAGKDGKGKKGPDGGGTPGDAPAPVTPPAGGFGGLFAALDKDRDGRLSRAEFPGTDDEWRRLDRDANGWVTPEEAAK